MVAYFLEMGERPAGLRATVERLECPWPATWLAPPRESLTGAGPWPRTGGVTGTGTQGLRLSIAAAELQCKAGSGAAGMKAQERKGLKEVLRAGPQGSTHSK